MNPWCRLSNDRELQILIQVTLQLTWLAIKISLQFFSREEMCISFIGHTD